jgi:hypothetical protein
MLTAYSSYNFILNAQKDSKKITVSVILTIVELNLPALSVNYASGYGQRPLLPNEELQFNVQP